MTTKSAWLLALLLPLSLWTGKAAAAADANPEFESIKSNSLNERRKQQHEAEKAARKARIDAEKGNLDRELDFLKKQEPTLQDMAKQAASFGRF